MQTDVHLLYEESLDQSHHGYPTIVETVYNGRHGCPRIHINPAFLEWAYAHRSTAGICRFLNVGRSVVRNALLEYEIVHAQENPFPSAQDDTIAGDFLDPNEPLPLDLPANVLNTGSFSSNALSCTISTLASFTGPLSTISDVALDDLISQLRSHFRRAGLTMLDGMLRRLGHRLPRERIRHSLMRIDPVQRVFQRIRIRRRVYSVPGPNSLWHHDGQHSKFSIHLYVNKSLTNNYQ